MSIVSKRLLDKAAMIFITNPGVGYSRADIQNNLSISKATACRLMGELFDVLPLTEETEGRITYYTLPVASAKTLMVSMSVLQNLDEKERFALSFLLGSAASSPILSSASQTLSHKLSDAGIISDKADLIRELYGAPQDVKEENKVFLETIFSAIEAQNEIIITYKGPHRDAPREYRVQPIGLFLREGNLYLYSYGSEKNDYLTFAFSRINDVDVLYDRHFPPHDRSKLEEALIDDPFGIPTDEPIRARAIISGRQVPFEREKKWPKDTVLTSNEDGSLTIEVTIRNYFAFTKWALSMGRDCRILEPAFVSDWIREVLKDALQHYT